MKKPTIAVDCDDVIVLTAPLIINHYNKTYGAKLTLNNYYSTDPAIWQTADLVTALQRVNLYLMSEEYQQAEPLHEAIEVLGDLQAHYELHIITGRPDFLAEATKNMLAQYFPAIFQSVEFTNFFEDAKSRPKAQVCQELDATLLIDDHLHHALTVAECGIDVLLFGDYPWNQADHLPDNIRRVRDWHEVAGLLLDLSHHSIN